MIAKYDRYKNKKKRDIYLKEWRRKNRKRLYQYNLDWRSKNPDKHYKYSKNSDYFKNASPISKNCLYRHGLNAIIIYKKYNKKCAYCGQNWDLTIHHLDNQGRNKIKKGLKPNNNINNLILICRKCHGSIHGKQSWSKRYIK